MPAWLILLLVQGASGLALEPQPRISSVSAAAPPPGLTFERADPLDLAGDLRLLLLPPPDQAWRAGSWLVGPMGRLPGRCCAGFQSYTW